MITQVPKNFPTNDSIVCEHSLKSSFLFLGHKNAKFIKILSKARYLHWDYLAAKVRAEDL